MAILALGKLGSRQMTIRSDLDLIIVYEPPAEGTLSDGPKPLSPSEYYTKVTQRLVNALSAQTGEGTLYEVDMRLRPSGNKGPLAVSLEGFAAYQRDSAWTWEHMALTRARVIWGPSALRDRLDAEIRTVLTRPRDPDALLRDVASMRARIDKEFGTKDRWDTKYVRGGQIDAEFIAQYMMLRHGAEAPQVLSTNMATALGNLARARFLGEREAEEICQGLRMWRRIQGFLRLTTEGKFDTGRAPEGLRRALFRAVMGEGEDFDFDALVAHIDRVAARTHGHFQRLVEQPASRIPPADHQQEPA